LRYAVKRLDEVPPVPEDGPTWFPLQHHFGLSAFGANVFRAAAPDAELVAEHDESASGQEELYLLVAGEATFELDGESFRVTAPAVVAVPEPNVRRRAVAVTAGTTLLAIGAPPRQFESTWDADHFTRVPRA
jgi:quercetin dioxygenase-like cupin family protein